MDDVRSARIAELIEPFRVTPGTEVVLGRDHDPGTTVPFAQEADAAGILETGVDLLAHYQARLAAQDTNGVLVVFQALDAGGKDSTIKHVMSGVNPQGVVVHSFKAPSAEELDHDYLWRFVRHAPARGEIAIFNRSHYEDVLVGQVHDGILERQKLPSSARSGDVFGRRYRQINDWERHLAENGFSVVKLFLNLSKEEQRRRFLRRIDRPEKNWKFKANDVREREHWDAYQAAFSRMLSNTSTEWAPWYVIPADHKWYLRVAAAAVLVHTLAEIDPQYPTVSDEERRALAGSKAQLLGEAPRSVPADPAAAPLVAAGKE